MKKPPIKPDIHFRISSRTYKYLSELAKQRDRSISYLIEQIVEEWAETHAQEPKSDEAEKK